MLSNSQKQKFDYLYRVFDKNGNNQLEEQDFQQLFKAMAIDEAHAKKAQKAARRWWLVLKIFGDKNKDTALSKEEWFTWATVIADKFEIAEKGPLFYERWSNTIFFSIDYMNKGNISFEEYQTWFEAFGFSGDAAEIFQRLDKSGNGHISRDEFGQLTQEFAKTDTEPAGNYLFGNPF